MHSFVGFLRNCESSPGCLESSFFPSKRKDFLKPSARVLKACDSSQKASPNALEARKSVLRESPNARRSQSNGVGGQPPWLFWHSTGLPGHSNAQRGHSNGVTGHSVRPRGDSADFPGSTPWRFSSWRPRETGTTDRRTPSGRWARGPWPLPGCGRRTSAWRCRPRSRPA